MPIDIEVAVQKTRLIRGFVHLPQNVAAETTGDVTLELRDVSDQDGPSILLASTQLPAQALEPGARLPFELPAPEADARRTLSMRVHIMAGPAGGGSRDAVFLSTQSSPVASQGDVFDVQAPVTKVS